MDRSNPATGNPASEVSGIDRSLGRALVYRFLSLAYRHPDGVNSAALVELRDTVRDVLARLAEFGPETREAFDALASRPTAWEREAREISHVTLFGHAPSGPCPPYEAQYGESDGPVQMPHELSDIGAFYRAFGLEPSPRSGERVDFIAVESEFLSFLCQKQAYAEESGDSALAGAAVDGQRRFFRDHLGRWAPAFGRRVLREINAGFHHDLARFTIAWIADEGKRFGVATGAEGLPLRAAIEERDACFDCPHAQTSPYAPAQGAPFEV